MNNDSNLAFLCKTCNWYKKAREVNYPSTCLSVDGCCSPINKGNFHEYNGEISKDNLHNFCFICGKVSTIHVKIRNKDGIYGLCQDHRLYPITFQPEHFSDHDFKDILIMEDGKIKTFYDIRRKLLLL